MNYASGATWMVGIAGVVLLCGLGGTVQAEPYVQLQGGIGFPSRLSSFEGEYWGKGRFSVSDLALQSGPAYGAKVGYWLASVPALGLDVDYLHTAPGDRQQDYWLTYRRHGDGPDPRIGATEPTISLRIDSLALDVALRYPR